MERTKNTNKNHLKIASFLVLQKSYSRTEAKVNLVNRLSLKKSLARRYIPPSMKWESVLKGIGKLYRAIYDELEKGGDAESPSEALANARA
jgi:hypothetical protein